LAGHPVDRIAGDLPVRVSELLGLESGCQHRTINRRADTDIAARTTRAPDPTDRRQGISDGVSRGEPTSHLITRPRAMAGEPSTGPHAVKSWSVRLESPLRHMRTEAGSNA
jgi:hypothetical protein